MRSAIFKGVDRPIAIESRPDPTPDTDEVVLKISRCGLCGSDVHMTEAHAYTFPIGTALGHEFSGEIVALGTQVTGRRIGEIVAAMPVTGCGRCDHCERGHPAACPDLRPMMGGFSEFALAKAATATPLPACLTLEDGALVEPLACALRTVTHGGAGPGTRAVVMGGGAVGLGIVFWLRRLGVERIVVVARSRWRESLAFLMGADRFLLNDEQLPAQLKETLGEPPDLIFDAVGSPGIIAQAIDLVRPRGTIVVAGCCARPDSFIPFVATMKELRLQFASFYTLHDFRATVDALERSTREVRQLVTSTIALDALPDALESMRAGGRHCKILVDPWMS